MKNAILTMLVLCSIGLVQANLLSNGDFETPQAEGWADTGWTSWNWGEGWSEHTNTKTTLQGGNSTFLLNCGNNWEQGGGGAYQTLGATAGVEYTLTVDSAADAWWLPTGAMSMIWLDASGEIISEATRYTVDPAVYELWDPEEHPSTGTFPNDIAHPFETYSLTATAPAGTSSVKVEFSSVMPFQIGGSVTFDNASLTMTNNPVPPYDPDPANGEDGVLANSTLSWHVSDPNGVLDPNLVSHNLYMAFVGADDPNDPNLVSISPIDIESWDGGTLRASYSPGSDLTYDARYRWRVDMVKNNGLVVTGPVWEFYTQLSIPEITAQPEPYTLVEPGAPTNLSATITSVSAGSYQWYQDGAAVGALGVIMANSTTVATYSVGAADAGGANDGTYTCVVDNEATDVGDPLKPDPIVSDPALVGTKREIAHWSFETGSTDSSIGGAATTTTVNESPTPDVGGGIDGNDAMVFDANDMLYTDPNATYFDICDYNMTVGCWIKSDSNDVPDWSPLIARNGEEDGWQLRRGNTGAIGDQRVVFSTRGLAAVSGGNDGSASLDTPFDEQWHYVVATYDGASRKVYVDGIVQLVWWVAEGAPQSAEGDDATGTITPSVSGVSIAGRYGQNPAGIDDQFIAGTYDEVEIWNYARSAEEIAQTYANLSGNDICESDPAYDLTDDCKVNLDDFTKLASEWLTDNNIVDQTP